ncbi:hypothetical protein L6R52_15855 [Myxococcota bacterium]|nr:hypothetical protein [Myxococcota bacterium]
MRLFARSSSAALLAVASLAACSAPSGGGELDTRLYALVEGVDGVFFHPPFGPEVSATGRFEATLLDGLSVELEAEAPDGVRTPLAVFDARTTPSLALNAPHERYYVGIPAAAYLTRPEDTYRVRVLLDGSELGVSVLSSYVFTVMGQVPGLVLGVQVRVEGSDVVRARIARRVGPATHVHCTDGVQNKDETGVDCGGSCAPCCTPIAEICDGSDNDCNDVVDDLDVAPTPATGAGAFTNTTHYGCARNAPVTVSGGSVAEVASRVASLANGSGCGGNTYSVASADEATGVFSIACAGTGACSFGGVAARNYTCAVGGYAGGACTCDAPPSTGDGGGGGSGTSSGATWTNTTYYGCRRAASVTVTGDSVLSIALQAAALANGSGCVGNTYGVASANETTGAFTISCTGNGACGFGGTAVRIP